MRAVATRRALQRARVEREVLIAKLRGFALAFNVLQSAIETGDRAWVTWVLVGVLAADWAVTSTLLRRDAERHHVLAGWLGMVLDVAIVGGVLANNRTDPADPVFLVVLFLSLMAALRWGRLGGLLGGLVSGLMAAVWGITLVDPGQTAYEHASMRFFVIAIVGGITGGLVHRLDQERARLAELAYHDPLTGLANRTALQEVLGQALDQGQFPALVYLDLDGFKAVNDRHGHSVGDQLLRGIADRLRLAVREQDLVARLGGDEFVVVVPGESAATVHDVVDRLRPAVVEPVAIGERLVVVGVSCGAVVAEPGDSVDMVLRRADDAMYRSKRAGRDAATNPTTPPT